MPIIEWNDTYSLGMEEIDHHHRHLVTLLNTTYDLFSGGGYRVEIEGLIKELINYATYHFAAEEQLMSRHDYTGAEDHINQHEDFIKQIRTFQKDFIDGRKKLSLELIVFLQDWLLQHISKSDRAYADAIGLKLKKGQFEGIHIELEA